MGEVARGADGRPSHGEARYDPALPASSRFIRHSLERVGCAIEGGP